MRGPPGRTGPIGWFERLILFVSLFLRPIRTELNPSMGENSRYHHCVVFLGSQCVVALCIIGLQKADPRPFNERCLSSIC